MAVKNKTHKATSKRFRVTGTGKLVHKRQGDNNHYMSKMSKARKSRTRKEDALDSSKEVRKLKKLANIS